LTTQAPIMKGNLQFYFLDWVEPLGRTAFWLCLALFAASIPPTYAQIVQGEPGVGNPGATKLISSPIYLDATQFATTTDVCAAIHAAIAQMNSVTNNGVVDARGFTGPQKCASNIFPSNATGKLLLGNVVLYATVSQVQPPLFQVQGTGWAIDDNVSNTIIRACTGAGTYCSGALGSPPVLWCWGKSGSCGNGGTGDTAVFGSFTQYALFDCNGLLNCVAMQAFDTEEGSGCWHCQFHGWGNSGIGLQICTGTLSLCQNSSFQDLYFSITPDVSGCTTSAVPIVVNTGSADNGGPKFIRQVTVDAGNCTGTGNFHPYDAIRFSALKTALEDINLQGTTVGVRVAGDSAANSVTIDSISAGKMVSQPGTQCGNPLITTIQAILLDSAHPVTNVSLHSIRGDLAGGNVIQDCSNNRTVTGTSENHSVGAYLTGPAATPASGGVAFTTSTSLGAFPSGLQQTVNTVAFSTTPPLI
jgi:hypothetical protein